MKTTDISKFSRKEIADRTFQRIVYRKLVDFQTAIKQARRQGAELGICGELDTKNLIEDICRVGDIEYRSIEEQVDYNPPELPDAQTVTDVPIISLDDDNVSL